MVETIDIKRKEFVVLEKLNDNAFKVERKGKIYFLKKYSNKDEFNLFVENQRRLKITALDIPKVYMFDKNLLISVVDFIEGETMLDAIKRENITNEEIFRLLFLADWYMKREHLSIDYSPENFKFTGTKLVYLPFKLSKRPANYDFCATDLRLWFATKQQASYVKSKGFDYDDSRVGNEYASNKHIALMTVKYYR